MSLPEFLAWQDCAARRRRARRVAEVNAENEQRSREAWARERRPSV